MGWLDGKAVLVTGAGGGIGRAHALAMAAEGAKVVVNDLGGTRDGVGDDTSMASAVVREIEEAGGEAIANFDSVTDPDGCARMVAAAVDAWGRLDVVVNNAGILRDKTFAKMTDAEWHPVIDLHLNGTRNVCAAALDALKTNGGAIINTTSYSGMIGNFGQSNYGAAKAGIYGFSRVLALELRKHGVTVNCVSPVAKTRMTEDIAMVDDEWGPEAISPIVVFLASEAGKNVTGRVFGVQGPRIHLYEVKVNDGVEKAGNELWTVEEIARDLPDIMAFEAPAPTNEAEGDELTHAFSFFPHGFKPDAAGDWTAVIHWAVKGGADQTLTIGDGVCTHSAGLHGAATCTVTVDRDTLLAMMTGEMDPTKAFMSGKASADNMSDLMKLATVFDFAKAAKAYAAADQAPADVVSDVFDHFPAGFKPERAGDWRAVVHWVVDGGTSQTLHVADGACTVAHALEGTATCTVKVSRDVLVAMFTGELDATKAFMSGKATADNMGDLMKLATAFDFAAVEAAYREASGEPAVVEASDDAEPAELPIGKRYDGGFHLVTAAEAQAYAAATNDDNPAYQGDDAVAPPMYHVRAIHSLMMKMATDPALGLDLLRLVHGEHSMTFHKPLVHGDVLHVRGELASVVDKPSGRVATYRIYGFVDGALAIEGSTTYFVRAASPGAKKASKAPGEAPPEPQHVIEQHVDPDQADRYALASGDDNPIHTDPETAKRAGLPGVILHGLCTMALAQRDLVNTLAGGDPRRLRSLSVRFAKPVFPGESLTLKVWTEGDAVSFLTENASGKTVIANGKATLG